MKYLDLLLDFRINFGKNSELVQQIRHFFEDIIRFYELQLSVITNFGLVLSLS